MRSLSNYNPLRWTCWPGTPRMPRWNSQGGRTGEGTSLPSSHSRFHILNGLSKEDEMPKVAEEIPGSEVRWRRTNG